MSQAFFMTTFGRNKRIFKARLALTSAVFIVGSLLPQYALGFENPLASPTQELQAPIDVINQATNTDVLPSYSYSDTGAAVSVAPILTQTSTIPHKTASAHHFASFVPTAPNGSAMVVLEGMASYYSRAGCLGCNPLFVMANGQVLDDNGLTMAIGADKVYLVGHTARVTNLANGKSVNVRITDTGGFYQDKYGNRVADLTIGTKQAIGMNGGLGQVRIEVF
jgi:rare lipoprotein A (peptidoglycan hydrolase)